VQATIFAIKSFEKFVTLNFRFFLPVDFCVSFRHAPLQKPIAGNPHDGFDVAGVGNVAWLR